MWKCLVWKCLSWIELKKRIVTNSTFITKNNTKNFPIMPFHRMAKARYGDRPASHWATMTAVASDVKIIAIACTWVQRGMSYFMTTRGSAEMHEEKIFLMLKIISAM